MIKRIKENNHSLKYKSIAIIVLIIFIAIFLLMKLSVNICEWYSRNVSANLVKMASSVSRIIPLSIYELAIYFAIMLGLVMLITLIVKLCKKRWSAAMSLLYNIIIIILSVALIYISFASLNYNRAKVQVPVYDSQINADELYSITKQHIERLNYLSKNVRRDDDGNVVNPYDKKQLGNKICALYDKYLNNGYFSDNSAAVKEWLIPQLLAQLRLSGVFFAPSGEVNINTLNVDWDLPAVTAHEIAHSKGVMRESDANLASYYVTMLSDDNYIAYSGYMDTFGEMLYAVMIGCGQEEYKTLYSMIDDNIWYDIKQYKDTWLRYDNLKGIGEFFNNIYLKLSGVKDGVNDYHPNMGYDSADNNGEFIYKNITYTEVQKMIFALYIGK